MISRLISTIRTKVNVSLAIFFQIISSWGTSVQRLSVCSSLVSINRSFIPCRPSCFLIYTNSHFQTWVTVVIRFCRVKNTTSFCSPYSINQTNRTTISCFIRINQILCRTISPISTFNSNRIIIRLHSTGLTIRATTKN